MSYGPTLPNREPERLEDDPDCLYYDAEEDRFVNAEDQMCTYRYGNWWELFNRQPVQHCRHGDPAVVRRLANNHDAITVLFLEHLNCMFPAWVIYPIEFFLNDMRMHDTPLQALLAFGHAFGQFEHGWWFMMMLNRLLAPEHMVVCDESDWPDSIDLYVFGVWYRCLVLQENRPTSWRRLPPQWIRRNIVGR